MVAHQLAQVIAVAALAGGLVAGDAAAFDGHGGRDSGRHHRENHAHRRAPDLVGGGGLPSVLPGIGTYAGAVSAMRLRGHGIYFAATSSPDTATIIRHRAPKARIIEISAASRSACSYEAGVCVIRP